MNSNTGERTVIVEYIRSLCRAIYEQLRINSFEMNEPSLKSGNCIEAEILGNSLTNSDLILYTLKTKDPYHKLLIFCDFKLKISNEKEFVDQRKEWRLEYVHDNSRLADQGVIMRWKLDNHVLSHYEISQIIVGDLLNGIRSNPS